MILTGEISPEIYEWVRSGGGLSVLLDGRAGEEAEGAEILLTCGSLPRIRRRVDQVISGPRRSVVAIGCRWCVARIPGGSPEDPASAGLDPGA